MEQGRTLYEIMTGANKPKAVEDQFHNPARVKIGGVVTINTLDYRHLLFTVKEMSEWKRVINGVERVFTDYRLLARPAGQEDAEVILRMIPTDGTPGGPTHNACVLGLFFFCPHDDAAERAGVEEALADDVLVYKRGEPNEEVFHRINTKSAYDCNVAVIRDIDGDGKVVESEVAYMKYKMWDYFRPAKVDGVDMTEFLYVHQEQTAGFYEMWRGLGVETTAIKVA